MRLRPRSFRPRLRGPPGRRGWGINDPLSASTPRGKGQESCFDDSLPMSLAVAETRLLVLNADPVFNDNTLGVLVEMEGVELRIVRSLSEVITVLLEENFDAFVAEAEAQIAVEQAVSIRQHFPSLRILCVVPARKPAEAFAAAQDQNIRMLPSGNRRRLLRGLMI